MKNALIVFMLLLCIPCFGWCYDVTCNGTTDQVKINAAVTAASDGGTITVAPTACTLTDVITWGNKSIALIGASTSITRSSAIPAIQIFANKASRITGFVFDMQVNASAIRVFDYAGSPVITGLRIDHNTFNGRAIILYGVTQNSVIDNNVFNDAGQGTTFIESTAWAWNNGEDGTTAGTAAHSDTYFPAFGENKFVFIEDNIFRGSAEQLLAAVDQTSGASVVFRHNALYGAQYHVHSPGNNGRGAIYWEIYENTFNGKWYSDKTYTVLTGSTPSGYMGQIRAGTGLIWNNTVLNLSSGTPHFTFDDDRMYSDPGGDDNPYSPGCDGTNTIVDGNIEANGWPCMDQQGRGSGTLKSQVTQPTYVWGNGPTKDGSSNALVVNNCGTWIKTTAHGNGDVDYCLHDTTTGCGNKGAWAYAPYTYPHPLRSGDKTHAPWRIAP